MKKPPYLTHTACAKLQKNWRDGIRAEKREEDFDPSPVVRLYLPGTDQEFFLTEQNPDDPNVVYGVYRDTDDAYEGEFLLGDLNRLRSADKKALRQDRDFRSDEPLSALLPEEGEDA